MTPRDDAAGAAEGQQAALWQDRVLCALDALAALDQDATPVRIKEMVGARFASNFTADARLYEGSQPAWEREVDDAAAALVARKVVARRPAGSEKARSSGDEGVFRITKSGQAELEGACERGVVAAGQAAASAGELAAGAPFERWVGSHVELPGVFTPPLRQMLYSPTAQMIGDLRIVGLGGDALPGEVQYGDLQITNPRIFSTDPRLQRSLTQWPVGMGGVEWMGTSPELLEIAAGVTALTTSAAAADTAIAVVIELNLRFTSGLAEARQRVIALWDMVQGANEPVPIADQYMAGDLTPAQMEGIVAADAADKKWPERAIVRMWLDYAVHPQLDASTATIKALPAQRSFGAFGDDIVWAVIDSGIHADHPHFTGYHTLDDPLVRDLHRDFTQTSDDHSGALTDQTGHGTHVAAIIAGGLQHWQSPSGESDVIAAGRRFNAGARGDADPILQRREVDPALLAGVAPRAKLVSLKVLAEENDPDARTRRVMQALDYVRTVNGSGDKALRIHGVNLSLGYPYGPQWACGQTPLCVAVDSLVRSGVVVVAAAGNTGYVSQNPTMTEVRQFSAGMTINDPGNAARAITVGSTSRDAPHTNGISHFSSRGPTGDGRLKPDLVAPGEDILSAAAGESFDEVARIFKGGLAPDAAVYIEDTGTSMAAPHVSGAIAAYLSVQRELIGQPEEIKRIFMETATSLRRDPNSQGAGMVDLMRALQVQ
jgi:serine protease AprX